MYCVIRLCKKKIDVDAAHFDPEPHIKNDQILIGNGTLTMAILNQFMPVLCYS